MTLEQTMKLMFERKLKSILRLSVPLPGLLILMTAGTVWLTAYFTQSIFSLLSSLESPFRLWLAYSLGFTLVILTLMLTLVRSLTLRGLANESIAALPITAGAWARASSRYFYLSQLPLTLGVFLGSVVNLLVRSHLPFQQVLGLAALLGVSISAMFVAAHRVTVWALARNNSLVSIGSIVGYIVISGVVAYALYRVCLGHRLSGQFWLPALLTTGAICLLYGFITVVASHLARSYTTSPLPLADDAFGPRTYARTAQAARSKSITAVMARLLLRDKKLWMVGCANLVLAGFMCVIGIKAGNVQTDTFFISFLPTLLILGQASVAAEMRGQLGSTREAIYALPVSSRQVVTAQLMVGLMFIAGLVVPLTIALVLALGKSVALVPLVHWLLTCLLAAVVACLTGVLFFESKRDASRGILAGVVLFLLLLPALAFDGWLQSKSVGLAVGMVVGLVVGLLEVAIVLERKLLLGGK